MTYFYWTLRWVPDTVRGEFVNIGVLVGSDETGDWAIRYVESFHRANSLGGDAGRAISYLQALGRRVASSLLPPGAFDEGRGISVADVERLRRHYSNSVQLGEPEPVAATSAVQALELLYPLLVEEPPARQRDTSRLRLVRELQSRFEAGLPTNEVRIAKRVRARAEDARGVLDFVLRGPDHVQLAHAWSFNLQDTDVLAQRQQSWAWFVQEIRQNGARVQTAPGIVGTLAKDSPLVVLHDRPRTEEQHDVFESARAAWAQLDVQAYEQEQIADAVLDVRRHLALAS